MADPTSLEVTSPAIRVLIVDDDARLRRLCAGFLKRIGHQSAEAESGEAALQEVQRQPFDLLLTDYKMPGMTGDELIERLHALRPEVIPIIMTAFPSMELAIDAVRKGAYEFLTKPFEFKGFQEAIERALARRTEEKRRYQSEVLDRLIEMERQLGDRFELPHSLEDILATVAATVEAPIESVGVESADLGGDGLVAIVCEPIPDDRNLLKVDPAYHHFRTIYAVLRTLNEQVNRSGAGGDGPGRRGGEDRHGREEHRHTQVFPPIRRSDLLYRLRSKLPQPVRGGRAHHGQLDTKSQGRRVPQPGQRRVLLGQAHGTGY